MAASPVEADGERDEEREEAHRPEEPPTHLVLGEAAPVLRADDRPVTENHREEHPDHDRRPGTHADRLAARDRRDQRDEHGDHGDPERRHPDVERERGIEEAVLAARRPEHGQRDDRRDQASA